MNRVVTLTFTVNENVDNDLNFREFSNKLKEEFSFQEYNSLSELFKAINIDKELYLDKDTMKNTEFCIRPIKNETLVDIIFRNVKEKYFFLLIFKLLMSSNLFKTLKLDEKCIDYFIVSNDEDFKEGFFMSNIDTVKGKDTLYYIKKYNDVLTEKEFLNNYGKDYLNLDWENEKIDINYVYNYIKKKDNKLNVIRLLRINF